MFGDVSRVRDRLALRSVEGWKRTSSYPASLTMDTSVNGSRGVSSDLHELLPQPEVPIKGRIAAGSRIITSLGPQPHENKYRHKRWRGAAHLCVQYSRISRVSSRGIRVVSRLSK